MARGSESATWRWAGDTRHCDTCGNELRIKDVGLFYGLTERFIRCHECVRAKLDAFIAKTRCEMGMAPKVLSSTSGAERPTSQEKAA